ncbi:ribose 5-phosphate isomerase B [bacterium]|nr:ribose 5-phosphate isomerase B [bacterium]
MMKIALGSDHAGFKLKEACKKFLKNLKYDIKDFGCFNEKSCDYPDFALSVAKALRGGQYAKGILFCGSGIGMSMTANKIPGIRAALVFNKTTAKLSFEHTNANVLCIPARFIGKEKANAMIKAWLSAKFGPGRHKKKVK